MSDANEAWRVWIHECPHLCNTDRCSFIAGFAAGQVAALETVTISDLSDELVRRDDEYRARAAELSKEQHDQPDAQFPN